MPFYQKGDVRIRYEETGAGFPLLVTPGGSLNSRGQQLAGPPCSTPWRCSGTTSAASPWTSATQTAASRPVPCRSIIRGMPLPTTNSA